MSCEDSSNQQYQLFWFNYFVSIGYIDNSDLVNLYAPYGKCTRKTLWVTYLINVIHFFLLSSGVLYLLMIHRNQSGLWWPFATWISSFAFLLVAIASYVLLSLDIYVKVFSILTIACQIVALLILSFSIFAVIKVLYVREHRYQRLLFLFIIILFILQMACFIGQILLTLHCVFNLRFASLSIDYSYLSAILAAIGTIISTLLMDHLFIWYLNRQDPSRVQPSPVSSSSEIKTRATSPVDPAILEYFRRQPHGLSYRIYANNDQTRQFHILPTTVANQKPAGKPPSKVAPSKNARNNKKVHPLMTSSDA